MKALFALVLVSPLASFALNTNLHNAQFMCEKTDACQVTLQKKSERSYHAEMVCNDDPTDPFGYKGYSGGGYIVVDSALPTRGQIYNFENKIGSFELSEQGKIVTFTFNNNRWYPKLRCRRY